MYAFRDLSTLVDEESASLDVALNPAEEDETKVSKVGGGLLPSTSKQHNAIRISDSTVLHQSMNSRSLTAVDANIANGVEVVSATTSFVSSPNIRRHPEGPIYASRSSTGGHINDMIALYNILDQHKADPTSSATLILPDDGGDDDDDNHSQKITTKRKVGILGSSSNNNIDRTRSAVGVHTGATPSKRTCSRTSISRSVSTHQQSACEVRRLSAARNSRKASYSNSVALHTRRTSSTLRKAMERARERRKKNDSDAVTAPRKYSQDQLNLDFLTANPANFLDIETMHSLLNDSCGSLDTCDSVEGHMHRRLR